MPIKFKCTDEGMWDVFSIHPNQGDGLRAVSRFIKSHTKWEPPEGVTVEALAKESWASLRKNADLSPLTKWENLKEYSLTAHIDSMVAALDVLGITLPVQIEKTRIFTTGQGYTAAALRKIADELEAE